MLDALSGEGSMVGAWVAELFIRGEVLTVRQIHILIKTLISPKSPPVAPMMGIILIERESTFFLDGNYSN